MAEQTKRARRLWLYLPYAIASIIVLGYYFLWRAGADEMKKGVEDWVSDQQDAGLEVSHGPLRAEGFPFFLRVHIETPQITTTEGWRWRADRLTMDALPYDLTRLIFSPSGEQTLIAGDDDEWRIEAADFRASIASDRTRDWVYSMTIGEFHAQRRRDGAEVNAQSLIFDLAPDASDKTTLNLVLAARGVTSSQASDDAVLDNLKASFSLTGTQWLYSADPLGDWRRADGAFIINGLVAELAESKLTVNGQVGLDRENYPKGRVDAEIVNPAPFALLLDDVGALSPDETQAAAAGLTLMSLAGGGKITAPIELKNGTAQIAGIKIADLPRAKISNLESDQP